MPKRDYGPTPIPLLRGYTVVWMRGLTLNYKGRFMTDSALVTQVIPSIEKKIPILHDDVPPGTAHLIGNSLDMSFQSIIPFVLPFSEHKFLDR
jgi:hypothetical protein